MCVGKISALITRARDIGFKALFLNLRNLSSVNENLPVEGRFFVFETIGVAGDFDAL